MTNWPPVIRWCDSCGRLGRWTLTARVPDSTYVDGTRTVGACSPQHLTDLRRAFTARPWEIEETWVARIRLARYAADGPLSDPTELAAATGLDLGQIHQALGWQLGRAHERMQHLVAEARRARPQRGPYPPWARCTTAR
ncbi:MAG TPA: hypothetical protein VF755_21970 [Catenuloplanes sp.]